MQEINRALAAHLDATEMLKRITEPVQERRFTVVPQPGNRAERRAAEREARREAKRAAKASA